MKNLERLTAKFREAIDLALKAGEFNGDSVYCRFPFFCCGDTSFLLAWYLLNNGIKTFYVSGMYHGETNGDWQSHAWLTTYMTCKCTIIDITGDQFRNNSTFLNYDKSVYVGEWDDFHKLFKAEYIDICKCCESKAPGEFLGPRLLDLYMKISKYIK